MAEGQAAGRLSLRIHHSKLSRRGIGGGGGDC